MRSVNFIVDGYLDLNYLASIAKKCNCIVEEKKDLNELYFFGEKDGQAFYICLNKLNDKGLVDYDGNTDILNDLKDKRLSMQNPTWNCILYMTGSTDLVLNYLIEIKKDYPRMFICFDGDKKFRKF